MKHFLMGLAAATLAGGLLAGQTAAQERREDYRRSTGNLRPDHRTAAPAIQGSPPPRSAPHRGWGARPYRSGITPYYRDGYGSGCRSDYWYAPPAYGYDPYRGYPPAYPLPYYGGYYYNAPLYLPAETLYGPEAVKRFMGVEPGYQTPAGPNVVVVPEDDENEQLRLRGTNRESLALAWRFIGFGDAHFASQRYADAYQRYKKAAQVAPQLADPHFRQAYALIANGRYELAAKAIKRGLEFDLDWPRSNFNNDDLYGPNNMAKAAHLDALAKAATDAPQDADLLFLLGVLLHFDGQADRAATFFDRATQLPGGQRAHLQAFRNKPGEL